MDVGKRASGESGVNETERAVSCELVELLREGRFDEFGRRVGDRRPMLRAAQLRLADLRGAPLVDADLRDAYLRGADLRGLDLREADLDGASIRDAKLSGVRFPATLSPAEIELSWRHGTRLRATSAR
jgi:hypothetical protein